MNENQNLPVAQHDEGRYAFEKIERFQSMSAGMYWRAIVPVDRYAIPAGCVLLLKSIRWVDDKVHTLILEPHPLKVGKSESHTYLDAEGNEKSVWVKNDEHRFLVSDFLNTFEHEPDAVAIRDRELANVQAEINSLQQELADINTDPSVLAKVVFDKLKDDEPELLQLCLEHSRDPVAAQESVSLTVGDAVSRGITRESIDSMSGVINKEKRIAEIKSQWIQAKTEQIASTVKRMVPFFSEKAKAALATTEEQTTKANALLEGVASLELYVGTDVEVQRITTGRGAPATEKLTFVQRKLYAAEELALWADVDENFDFQSDDVFVNALASEPGFADQLFPTQRCVIVMATTRKSVDYGNGIINAKLNAINKAVFLLVRDGENLYRVYSPVESHIRTGNLFPSKDEQGRCFTGLDGSALTFDDVEYTDGLRKHHSFALHYKRFLLLAAGLDSREKLFGEFYPGEHSLEFMTLRFQEKYFAFIHDEDGEGLIEGDKRPSLDTWMSEKNKFLRSGSRVLCNWYSLMTPDSAPGACKHDPFRDGFDFKARPAEKFGFGIVEKDGDQLVVKVRVFKSYSEGPRSDFMCKVSLTEFRLGYWHHKQLPFLCLDVVTPEEVEWYMLKREVRAERHVEYIRFFKHALKFLKAEAEQQKGTRGYLKAALEEGVAEGEKAEQLVDGAVTAWRAANRGADLPTMDSDKSGKPWKSLLDQMYMLANDGQGRIVAAERLALKLGCEPLRLVLSGSAKLVLYVAPRADEVDDRLVKHAWVHRITLRTSRTGLHEVSRTWALLPVNIAAETILHQWGEPGHWANSEIRFFQTIGQKKAAFELVDGFKGRFDAVLRCSDEEGYQRARQQWLFARKAAEDRSGYVREADLILPFAVVGNLSQSTFCYLAIRCTNPVTLLRDLAPTDAARNQLLAEFIRPYKNKNSATSEFYGIPSWGLVLVEQCEALSRYSGFLPPRDVSANRAGDKPQKNDLLSAWFKNWVSTTGQKDHLVTGYAKGESIDGISLMLDQAELGLSVDTSQKLYNVHFLEAHEVEVGKGDEVVAFHMCEMLPVSVDTSSWSLGSFGCSSGSYSISLRTCYGAEAAMALVASKGNLLGLKAVEIGVDGHRSFKPSSIEGSRRFIFE